MDPVYLTACQAARILGLSSDRVTQLAREGRLPHVKTAAAWLYRPEDLEQYKARPLTPREVAARRRWR